MRLNSWIILIIIVTSFILGALSGKYLFSHKPQELIPRGEEITSDTVYVIKDTTIYLPFEIKEGKPEKFSKKDSLILSEKKFETNRGDIIVKVAAPCSVKSIIIETLPEPMIISYKTKEIVIEKIRYVEVKPKWYETREFGFAAGIMLTITTAWAISQTAQ